MGFAASFDIPTMGITNNNIQHGESQYNLHGRIGGDTFLSPRGELYAKKLPELVRQSVGVGLVASACTWLIADLVAV
jgi:hypothetical protein